MFGVSLSPVLFFIGRRPGLVVLRLLGVLLSARRLVRLLGAVRHLLVRRGVVGVLVVGIATPAK